MIPVILPIIEDEDLRGYVIRIAKENLMTPKDFCEIFLKYRPGKGNGFIRNISLLAERDIFESGFSAADLMFRHTPLMVQTIFSREAYIGKQMDMILHDVPSDYFAKASSGKKFMYCPKCAREDKDRYGEAIVRTPHQILGVNTCYKHGLKLTSDPDGKIEYGSDEDKAIAKFAHTLFEEKAYSSIEKTKEQTELNNRDLRSCNNMISQGLIYIYRNRDRLNCESSDDRDPFITFHCSNCGSDLIRHELSVKMGITCPACAKKMNNVSRIKAELLPFVPDDYSIEAFHEHCKITLKHDPCNTVIKRSVRGLLYSKSLICPVCSGHLGEEKLQNCGKVAKVIKYDSYHHIDVQFDTGEILQGVSYDSFKRGALAPEGSVFEYLRLGKEKLMKCGQIARIIRYGSNQDIDVSFEDGSVKRNTSYVLFTNGTLSPPDSQKKKWIGCQAEMNCGDIATIISYRNNTDIDVAFQNGVVKQHVTLQSFKNRRISSTHHDNKYCKEAREGMSKVMKCGLKATIIRYNNVKEIDVMFENGMVRENVCYEDFKIGRLTPISDRKEFHKSMRTGEERMMKCGLKAKIIEYRGNMDMDVQFENGIIKKHVRYFYFKEGILTPATQSAGKGKSHSPVSDSSSDKDQ